MPLCSPLPLMDPWGRSLSWCAAAWLPAGGALFPGLEGPAGPLLTVGTTAGEALVPALGLQLEPAFAPLRPPVAAFYPVPYAGGPEPTCVRNPQGLPVTVAPPQRVRSDLSCNRRNHFAHCQCHRLPRRHVEARRPGEVCADPLSSSDAANIHGTSKQPQKKRRRQSSPNPSDCSTESERVTEGHPPPAKSPCCTERRKRTYGGLLVSSSTGCSRGVNVGCPGAADATSPSHSGSGRSRPPRDALALAEDAYVLSMLETLIAAAHAESEKGRAAELCRDAPAS
eukprot:EG_transcript_21429